MTTRSLAIIGAGPRGTSLLDRISNNIRLGAGDHLHVLIIDPFVAGPGRVWRTDQDHDLVMNTYAGQATLFVDDSVRCVGPREPAGASPDLMEWVDHVRRLTIDDNHDWADSTYLEKSLLEDHELVAEVARTVPYSHPSRALFGHYLRWFFNRTTALLPVGVTLELVQDRLVDLLDATDGRQRLVLENGAELTADAVVLAIGWLDAQPSPADASLREVAAAAGLGIIEPQNPFEQRVDQLPAGEPVIVRGFGMGFFDLVSRVTLGRGGRFEPVASVSAAHGHQLGASELVYHASGQEPVLHVGSGRGIPFRTKTLYGSVPPNTPQANLRALSIDPNRNDLDFNAEVLPAIRRDAVIAYYTTLAQSEPDAFVTDAAELIASLADSDEDAWDDLIAGAVPVASRRWSLSEVHDPTRGQTFESPRAFTAWLDRHVEADLVEASRGSASALKAAAWSLGQARGAIVPLIQFGRLSPDSFASGYQPFQALGNMLASGPPAFRLAQLRALIAAGIVRPVGPRISVTVKQGADGPNFVASSPAVSGSAVSARWLVDAWMHGNAVTTSREPLIGTLLARGEIRPHTLTGGPEPRELGALDVERHSLRLLDHHGTAHPRRHAIGIPTESAVFFTTISPIPKSNASLLRETDAVARAVLSELNIGVAAATHS
ncbi:FAD/NAD(P)-binding protein [Lysinibacter cavernae]|uniref:FAD-dependent urate hydroxylase HpyO/Asp monooxygenase CreE-like FAD/NAD(P)-binding domain-containing protein n=1 Tax=Lysinibacter cavernae TaxID=1640652 RepID=A0A7X5R3M3_9MICO|nr:FAD/NAD(P)-binding protein [Lysinibacter cavernae]NIH55006.1 hypothetical protein [Lysinibacter cavernae]